MGRLIREAKKKPPEGGHEKKNNGGEKNGEEEVEEEEKRKKEVGIIGRERLGLMRFLKTEVWFIGGVASAGVNPHDLCHRSTIREYHHHS